MVMLAVEIKGITYQIICGWLNGVDTDLYPYSTFQLTSVRAELIQRA